MNDEHKKARVGARALEVLSMSLQSISDLLTKKGANGSKPLPVDAATMRVDKTFNHAMDLPKRVGYGIERIKITPELAQFYLGFNRVNRIVTQRAVDEYADEMARGEWRENGESIKFSKTQALLDGQHRLLAIMKSGVTLHVMVAFGLEDEVRTTMDIARRRSSMDTLSYQGLGSFESKIAGAAAHHLINHQYGISIASNMKRKNREVETFYLEFSRFRKSVDFVAELQRKNVPIPHARAVVLHFLFAEKDTAQADSFIEKLFTGESIARNSPIYQLREKLNEALRTNTPYNVRQQFHSCIKAWNYFRGHKPITSSRTLFPRSDEALPEIV